MNAKAPMGDDPDPQPDWAFEAERVLLSLKDGSNFSDQVFALSNRFTDVTTDRFRRRLARLFRRRI
ncbi:MAG: hypothetical protein JWQ12_195 [Glaciihabitans sp.]|nr:hypothetical protein [Glaciihabitans sp.]